MPLMRCELHGLWNTVRKVT